MPFLGDKMKLQIMIEAVVNVVLALSISATVLGIALLFLKSGLMV